MHIYLHIMSHSRIFVALLLISCAASAQTLKQLLLSEAIPPNAFQEAELQQEVQAISARQENTLFIAYKQVTRDVLSGPIRLVSYDRASGAVTRRDLELDPTDVCSGSLWGISFIEDFVLISTSISPSAICTHVVDPSLHLRRTLYGFSPELIAPKQIVIIENMIHFAPVHPERLQLNDLGSGATVELYPPKDDALRSQLAAENAKHMPSAQTCARMNDPCDPAIFDEDISAFGTDGRGRFAFIVSQSASHAMKEEEPSETVASQSVLYVYLRNKSGWLYCQQKLEESEVERLSSAQKLHFEDAVSRCTPNLSVVPDMSTATYNPFLKE